MARAALGRGRDKRDLLQIWEVGFRRPPPRLRRSLPAAGDPDQARRRLPGRCRRFHPRRVGEADKVRRRRQARAGPQGNVISIVEKASIQVTDANAARMQEKMAKAEYDFGDFMAQSKLVSSMGSMAGVAKMLPGVGNMIDNSQLMMVEKPIKRSEAMICSMTKNKRANPDLLLTDRSAWLGVMRITKGSGLSFEDVR
jgi:hypothetical protein